MATAKRVAHVNAMSLIGEDDAESIHNEADEVSEGQIWRIRRIEDHYDDRDSRIYRVIWGIYVSDLLGLL
jgi:hypothetical protein